MEQEANGKLYEDTVVTATASRLTNIEGLKAEIIDNVTISVVAEHLGIELQSAGEQWRGLCPLHEESTPSWYCHDSKNQWHCFGCKEGGDAISLVEQVRHLGFIETLYYLASEADIDISQYERPMSDSEKEQEEIRRWCENWLDQETVAIGRLDLSMQTEFGVKARYPQLREVPNYFGDKAYLFDGVILPWRTPSGRLVGWRVREHDGREKHLSQTPNDFPLGKAKDQTLFGIQIAREHISDGILVGVEGEYDTMACHAVGIQNVVGMGGSSLTDGQVKLLESLHIRQFTAIFDGDAGGYAAAKAFAQKYWAHEQIFFRVNTCADEMDPEDEIDAFGDFGFLATIQGAKSALEFLLRIEWASQARNTLTEKLEFVKWIRDTYGAKLRSTDESLVLAEVAKWLEIPELEVRDYVRSADGSLCAIDSERLLVGQCCRDKQFYVHLRGRLARDDFFVLKHQRVWDMLASLLIDGQEFDLVTLTQEAGRHGVPDGYIEGCAELNSSNLEYHIGVVADLALRRSARDDAVAFRDRITDLGQPADVLVGDLTHRITTKALRKAGASQRQLSEQVDQAMDTLHERMKNESEVHGINLGLQFPRLSRILQGLQGKRLYQVAAISRMGKSTLLCHMCSSVGVHQSIPVDLITLEMDETEVLYKIASHMTSIDSTKISGGRLEPDEAKRVEYAMLRIRNSPLHIWAPDGMTATEFLLYARESVMQRRTQAFFVDYVQLIDPEQGQERDNGYKLYGDFARLAKMKVARAMDVAVVCAAQLSRQAANKERPTSEDMGDSYALVRHSDVVIIMHGQEDSSTMELWVDKNRGGSGGGQIPLIYDKPTQTFREASNAPKLPEYTITL